MNEYSSYYQILQIGPQASIKEIKSAFRKLALQYHPDKHDNSAQSNATFILINNAYQTLSDPHKRKEYDNYLSASTALKNWKDNLSAHIVLPGPSIDYHETVLNQLNVLLWDIEDIILAKKKWGRDPIRKEKIMRRYIMAILTFMDKWVLTVGGYPDYFMDARKMKRLDPLDYNNTLGLKDQGHMPFVSVSDYFYNIRKRMDKFLSKVKIKDLMQKSSEYKLSLLDCIIEVQNFTIHYLSYLPQVQAENIEEIPAFIHSHAIFEL